MRTLCWDRWLDVRVTLPSEAGPDGVTAMYTSLGETVDDDADVGWVVEAPPEAPVEFTTG